MRPGPGWRFVLVGLFNTALGYGVILLLQQGAGLAAAWANAGGFVVGGLVSYLLNRNFTFASNRPHRQAVPRFALAVGAGFVLNLGVLALTSSVWGWPGPLAQALAVASYALTFFLASRYLVFAD